MKSNSKGQKILIMPLLFYDYWSFNIWYYFFDY